MSSSIKTFLFVGLWLVSLVLVDYLARRPSLDPTPKTVPEKAPLRSSGHGLESEPLREARRRLLQLEKENEELRRQKELLVAQLAERQETPTSQSREAAAKKRLERRLNYCLDRAFSKGRGDDMFLRNIEENMMFAIELAKAGNEGTRFLLEFADNPERWNEALRFLTLLPSPAGLEAILSDPWAEEEQQEPGWEWDHVRWHIEDLPTSDVEPFLDTLGGRLRAQSEIAQLTDDEVYMCAQLALRHGHRASRNLLEEAWERLEVGEKTELVESLAFVETGAALSFVESVAQGDSAPSVREAAQAVAEVLSEFVAREQ